MGRKTEVNFREFEGPGAHSVGHFANHLVKDFVEDLIEFGRTIGRRFGRMLMGINLCDLLLLPSTIHTVKWFVISYLKEHVS